MNGESENIFLDDSDCTVDLLKKDNQKNIEGFGRTGDQVILIDKDHESAIREALNKKREG